MRRFYPGDLQIVPMLMLGAWLCACAAARSAAVPASPALPPPVSLDSSTHAGRAQLIAQLKQVALADRMNAQSWTDDNVTLDTAWYIKQKQVEAVIARLKQGEAVPPDELRRALDNWLPDTLGGYPN
jgi:hypothetical protein